MEVAKNVVNIDISDIVHKKRSRKPKDKSGRNIRARIEVLPFKDEAFDLVVAHSSVPAALKEIYNKSKAIAKIFPEIVRVMRTGGKALISPIGWAQPESKQTEGLPNEVKLIIEQARVLQEQNPNLRFKLVRKTHQGKDEQWYDYALEITKLLSK